MNALLERPTWPGPAEAPAEAMRRCARCGVAYVPDRRSAHLRLTYCGVLCEIGDLGFSLEALERMERRPR